jgi:hypothetical protein
VRVGSQFVPPQRAPVDRLINPGATAITVCFYRGGSFSGRPARVLAVSRPIPTAQVAEVAAVLGGLHKQQAFTLCLRTGPEPVLALAVGYPEGNRLLVFLVAPCSVYWTNGPFQAALSGEVADLLGLRSYLLHEGVRIAG